MPAVRSRTRRFSEICKIRIPKTPHLHRINTRPRAIAHSRGPCVLGVYRRGSGDGVGVWAAWCFVRKPKILHTGCCCGAPPTPPAPRLHVQRGPFRSRALAPSRVMHGPPLHPGLYPTVLKSHRFRCTGLTRPHKRIRKGYWFSHVQQRQVCDRGCP